MDNLSISRLLPLPFRSRTSTLLSLHDLKKAHLYYYSISGSTKQKRTYCISHHRCQSRYVFSRVLYHLIYITQALLTLLCLSIYLGLIKEYAQRPDNIVIAAVCDASKASTISAINPAGGSKILIVKDRQLVSYGSRHSCSGASIQTCHLPN